MPEDGPLVDVISCTGPCQDLSLANARRTGFNGSNATPHFANANVVRRAREISPRRVFALWENVIKEADAQRKDTLLCGGLAHVRVGTDADPGSHSRRRAFHANFPPVDAPAARSYANYQALLDDLYGEGAYDALVATLPCIKTEPPTAPAKRRVATGEAETLAIEEGLAAMGFPVDWFEGCGLEEATMWRLLGNSVCVSDLELFYASLADVFRGRHGRDAAAERDAAIAAFRRSAELPGPGARRVGRGRLPGSD